MSAFAHVTTMGAQRIWDGVTGRVVHGDKLTLAIVELEPDSLIPEHSHANEQVGFCVSGSLHFRVGEETCEVAPGHCWCIAAGVPHEVATGRGGAVVIESFAPPRADWADLERMHARPSWPQ